MNDKIKNKLITDSKGVPVKDILEIKNENGVSRGTYKNQNGTWIPEKAEYVRKN